jgi:hypothetical protein
LQNRLIQTSQTGGQRYSDTSPFSIPWIQTCTRTERGEREKGGDEENEKRERKIEKNMFEIDRETE